MFGRLHRDRNVQRKNSCSLQVLVNSFFSLFQSFLWEVPLSFIIAPGFCMFRFPTFSPRHGSLSVCWNFSKSGTQVNYYPISDALFVQQCCDHISRERVGGLVPVNLHACEALLQDHVKNNLTCESLSPEKDILRFSNQLQVSQFAVVVAPMQMHFLTGRERWDLCRHSLCVWEFVISFWPDAE